MSKCSPNISVESTVATSEATHGLPAAWHCAGQQHQNDNPPESGGPRCSREQPPRSARRHGELAMRKRSDNNHPVEFVVWECRPNERGAATSLSRPRLMPEGVSHSHARPAVFRVGQGPRMKPHGFVAPATAATMAELPGGRANSAVSPQWSTGRQMVFTPYTYRGTVAEEGLRCCCAPRARRLRSAAPAARMVQ